MIKYHEMGPNNFLKYWDAQELTEIICKYMLMAKKRQNKYLDMFQMKKSHKQQYNKYIYISLNIKIVVFINAVLLQNIHGLNMFSFFLQESFKESQKSKKKLALVKVLQL